jgi:hypothetical protein
MKVSEDRKKRWEMASTARMRKIVPGLFGSVEALYKRESSRKTHTNAIVFQQMRGDCGGTPTPGKQAFRNIDTNGFNGQICRRKAFPYE